MRYLILGMFCVVAAIAYIQRGALSVPAEEIAQDLAFADLAKQMGYVQGAWYLGYALLQLPGGWVADRLGSRVAAAGFCLLWSGCTALAAFVQDFTSLLVVWGLMGACQAGVFPAAAKAVGQTFPDLEKARASGMLASGMQIGGALAPLITGATLEAVVPIAAQAEWYRWRFVFLAYAIPGFLWAALFLVLIPRQALPATPPRQRGDEAWWRALLSVPVGLLCSQQFFRAGAMVFFTTWFPVFLQKTRGVTPLESGLLATVTGVGGVLGSLSGGYLSDLLLRVTGRRRLARQGIAVMGLLWCVALVVSSAFIADTRVSVVVIALGVFGSTFGGVSGYTVAIEMGGKQVASIFSTMNMCGNLGASAFPVAAGLLVAATGRWDLILALFAASLLIAAACWALLVPPMNSEGES